MILCVGWDNRQCDGTPQSSHWKTYKGGPRAAATISIFKSYSVFLPNWHSLLSFPVIWPLILFRQTSKLIAPVHLGLRLVVDSQLHVHLMCTALVFQNELSRCRALLVFIVMLFPLHVVTVTDSFSIEENMGVYDCWGHLSLSNLLRL